MLVLGIESSCDETSFALLENDGVVKANFLENINSFEVKASIISSQIESHIPYGGIVPEVGARLHAQQIHYLFYLLLKQYTERSQISTLLSLNDTDSVDFDILDNLDTLKHLDVIYVTTNPGLASALRVGMEFAKTIVYFLKQKFNIVVEIVEINHLHGHIFSCFYNPVTFSKSPQEIFPHLHMIVSGGNSQLLVLDSPKSIVIVGQTLDDAAGECLDKIGRMLGLPYPGGANLAKIAGLNSENEMNFPVAMLKNQTLNYSFSGLKTSVRLYLEGNAPDDFVFEKSLSLSEIELLKNNFDVDLNPKLAFIKKVASSVQSVVVAQLLSKLKKATKEFKPNSIGLSGGVSANSLLRSEISSEFKIPVYIPQLSLTGDNAIMIALAGIVNRV
jgi:N6-L-threonylcarbamoyladenine synthase